MNLVVTNSIYVKKFMIALSDSICEIRVHIVYSCGFSHNQIIIVVIVELIHDTCLIFILYLLLYSVLFYLNI